MVTYPLIRFVCRYGRKISLFAGLLSWLICLFLAYHCQSVLALLVGTLGSLVLGALLRLLAEVIEVVADALLPR